MRTGRDGGRARATVGKTKQTLVWVSVYNVLAIPIAAGVLYEHVAVCRPLDGRVR